MGLLERVDAMSFRGSEEEDREEDFRTSGHSDRRLASATPEFQQRNAALVYGVGFLASFWSSGAGGEAYRVVSPPGGKRWTA